MVWLCGGTAIRMISVISTISDQNGVDATYRVYSGTAPFGDDDSYGVLLGTHGDIQPRQFYNQQIFGCFYYDVFVDPTTFNFFGFILYGTHAKDAFTSVTPAGGSEHSFASAWSHDNTGGITTSWYWNGLPSIPSAWTNGGVTSVVIKG